MINNKSEYDIQAEKFLKDTNTTFKATFLKWDYHFLDDKDKRDIYEIELKRGNRVYKFNFGQSLNASGEYILYNSRERIHLKRNDKGISIKNIKGIGFLDGSNSTKNKEFKEPSAYDVLACLQKYEIGTFKEFCDNFGYNEDSIKAEKTYKAVCEEYNNLKMLYSDEELLKMSEIQ